MVPFVQNTGIALLAKTTIAQVRPIHSSIGLNKDMRVWEQINTSNVLNPPPPHVTSPWISLGGRLMVWIRLAIPIGKPFPSSSPTFCTEMGPSLSVRFLALPFSDTSWSCPVTTMIIVMIAVKDLLIMTLARSARAVRGEALVPPLWIPPHHPH